MNRHTPTTDRESLAQAFFSGVPNARPASPMWQAFFAFMHTAHQEAKDHAKVLNIYASHDRSGNREHVYKEKFFPQSEYYGVDFWEDEFFPEETKGTEKKAAPAGKKYHLPYPDNYFDIIINTKIVMEHVTEPELMLQEFFRVLKPGGQAFIPAPHIRRQHQVPFDYFRYTEFAIKYLCEKVGFNVLNIAATNGYMVTATQYAYFFQRGLNVPKFIKKIFDWIHYWVVEPLGFWLDRFDNGYGRDFTLYFLTQVKKPKSGKS